MGSAGELTVWSLSAEASKAPLGGLSTDLRAWSCAASPSWRARSIPLPDDSIVCGMADRKHLPGLWYAWVCESASDRRHFVCWFRHV